MAWVNVGNIKGDTGKGISSIVGTTGNDSTNVSVSYDDGTSTTFEVMNGQPGYYVDVDYNNLVWKSGKKSYDITFKFYKPDGTLNTTRMYARMYTKKYPSGYFAGNVSGGELTFTSFDPEEAITILVGITDDDGQFVKVYYRILHLASGPSTINVNGKLDINYNGTSYTTADLYPARNDVLSTDTDIKLELIPIATNTISRTVSISNGVFNLKDILDPAKNYICNLGVTDKYGNIIRYTSTFIIPAMENERAIANSAAIEDLQNQIGTITSAQTANLTLLGS
jgi:hypothetical protein